MSSLEIDKGCIQIHLYVENNDSTTNKQRALQLLLIFIIKLQESLCLIASTSEKLYI